MYCWRMSLVLPAIFAPNTVDATNLCECQAKYGSTIRVQNDRLPAANGLYLTYARTSGINSGATRWLTWPSSGDGSNLMRQCAGIVLGAPLALQPTRHVR